MKEAVLSFFGFGPSPSVATSVAIPAERQSVVDAVASLSSEEFAHFAAVCVDIANRLPGTSFDAVGNEARTYLEGAWRDQ